MNKYFIPILISGVIAMPIINGLSKSPVNLNDKKTVRNQPASTIQTLIFSSVFKAVLRSQRPKMADPKIDEEPGPFSYFSKPSFQMGLPGQRRATQITPEGRLFTGAAELEFFAGENLEPVSQRVWTLYKGWLPSVKCGFEKDGVTFEVQAFQYWLGEDYSSPPVNFIKVAVRNDSHEKRSGKFGLGFEYGGSDHRPIWMRKGHDFNPAWKYEMTDEFAARDGRIIYIWDTPPDKKLAEAGKPYEKAFANANKKKPVCIAAYSLELEPGGSKKIAFKMPFLPMEVSDRDRVEALKTADYDDYLERMEEFWSNLLAPGMDIIVPEDKVTHASRAYRVHNFMCQNYKGEDEIQQVVNRFQYNHFWLRDGYFFSRMYGFWNFPEVNRKHLRHFLKYQKESGNFESQDGQLDGFGQALAAFGNYIRLTRDEEFAKEIFPAVRKGIAWLEEKLDKDPFGLMPKTFAMDNEQVIGRYTGHNFWALMGLDGAVIVAEAAGEKESADRFQGLRDAYYENFMRQLRKKAGKNDGIIPPGMDAPDGIDWGNLLPVYPGHLLDPFDPLVTKTFEHYRENHMEEGIATYASTMHHYVTERVAQTALVRDEQELAVRDFYAMLLHTGSCHEGFEFTIYPWSNRDYCIGLPGKGQLCNFPPHGWYAAVMNTLLRMMFVREQGNDLHLLSAISPEWVKPGDNFIVKNAATYFGIVNLKAKAEEGGVIIEFEPGFRDEPESILLHLPFFADVKSVKVNGSPVTPVEGAVKLPAGKCVVDMSWWIDPSFKYSYAKAVEDYKDEYRKRWKEKQ